LGLFFVNIRLTFINLPIKIDQPNSLMKRELIELENNLVKSNILNKQGGENGN